MDRRIAPKIRKVQKIKTPKFSKIELDNGIPLYYISEGQQDLIKMEVYFDAGRAYEEKKLVARATSKLIKEGSLKKSGSEIAELMDFYGANMVVPVNLDYSIFSFYSMKKHLDKLLPIWTDLICEPAFNESELDTFKRINLQRLDVELSKTDVIAYRAITEDIFGPDHPYGYNSNAQHYQNLTRADLLDHHDQNYNTGSCQVFLSGKVDEKVLQLINKHLGLRIKKGNSKTPKFSEHTSKPTKRTIAMPKAIQSSIRMACPTIKRNHQDYAGLFILNTIFGGYFGSRLMTNLRENKGLTYNIFSSIDHLFHESTLQLGTDVMQGKEQETLKEIEIEMMRLQSELVPEEELTMVRNYLMGSLMGMVDGAFNIASVLKTGVLAKMEAKYFEELVFRIQDIRAEEIQVLAQKYLNPDNMWKIVAGPQIK